MTPRKAGKWRAVSFLGRGATAPRGVADNPLRMDTTYDAPGARATLARTSTGPASGEAFDPSIVPAEKVAQRLGVDVAVGLSEDEARRRFGPIRGPRLDRGRPHRRLHHPSLRSALQRLQFALGDDERLPPHLFVDPWLWGALAPGAALQILVVEVPPLQVAFGAAALDLAHWAMAIAVDGPGAIVVT